MVCSVGKIRFALPGLGHVGARDHNGRHHPSDHVHSAVWSASSVSVKIARPKQKAVSVRFATSQS